MVPEIRSATDRISLPSPFNPPPPLRAQKMTISKMKKTLEISSFYISVPKIMIIPSTVPEIWHMTDVIVIYIFGFTFPFKPLTAQKMKISKQ